MSGARQVVVGIGNRFRCDDSAGLLVVDWLQDRVAEPVELLRLEGEPTALVDIFDSSELVILVDAVAIASAAGLVLRFDASDEPVPGSVFGASTHAFSLCETIELARMLGKLRARVLVYGITGEDFNAGERLSESVAEAVPRAGGQILRDLAEWQSPAPELKGASDA
ncbi:MAG TPA: hydrogenase maturation protease [Solirubrobacteraceae bacterium]|nr:hydrogenase maturation protease [Solirubrobacteraceae bacterium]